MSEPLFGKRQKQSLFILVLMIAGILYTNRCSDPATPEEQVRGIINELVAAAEKKDIGPFEKYLSEKIEDDQGRNKKDILNVLRLIFLQHPRISLHLVSLDLADNTNPNLISADLTLLMSETALPSDKGNFFITFRLEEDSWRVWSIKWSDGYGY